MAFHKNNLGDFGGGVTADLNGYVPEIGDGPWSLEWDHGTERTHNDDGSLTEYGRWWEEEGWDKLRDRAVAETTAACDALEQWQA